MATRKRVTWINRSGRFGDRELMSHIGGEGWAYTLKDAINYLKDNTFEFFIRKGDLDTEIIIGIRNGVEYLKAPNDGGIPYTLLSLPELQKEHASQQD